MMKRLHLGHLGWALIVIGAILMIISLTSCGAPTAGTVTGKDYDSSYSYWQAGTTTCSGQPSRCTTTPGYYVYVPENYSLEITNGDDSGWLTVDARMYDNTKVGDYYDRGQITKQ